MIYEIKKAGSTILSIAAKGNQDREAMVKDRLEMSFDLPVDIDIPLYSTVQAYGQTYKLNRAYNTNKKHDKVGTEYSLEFEALYYDLGKFLFLGLDKDNNLTNSEVFIMADAETIIDMIVMNANRVDSGWTKGVVIATEAMQFTFVNMSCLAVLSDLATRYSTEFWVVGKTINLYIKDVDSGLNLSFGKGNGLYNLFKGRTEKKRFNRLKIEGGSKNLPSGYGFTRLQLPLESRPFLEDIKPGEEVVEEAVYLDDIYPKRTGTITALGATDLEFIDSTIDFDLNSPSLSATIAFTSGLLSPFGEFKIVEYDHATKKIKIESKEDKAYPGGIPSAEMKVAVGDKYVLLAFEQPTSYVVAAEVELGLEGSRILSEGTTDQSEIKAEITPSYIVANSIELDLGSTAIISDAGQGWSKTVRVASFQRDLQDGNLYSNVGFKDFLKPSQIISNRTDTARIQYAVNNWSGMSSVAKSELIDQLSALGGYLFLNSIKIKAGFADEAAYALDSDKWDGHQFADYLNQSVRTGDQPRFAGTGSSTFASGFAGSGWKIDPTSGDITATFDNLVIRKEMRVYELVINQIRATNGALWVSDAARILTVSTSGANWVCGIDTAGGVKAVPFVLNDIIRCQRWDGRNVAYYTARVIAIAAGTFTITRIDGSSTPSIGDEVVRTGNTTNPDRQGAIYMTASDDGAPFIDVIDGVTGASLEGKTKVRLGLLDGLVDPDIGALSGYGLYGQNVYLKGFIQVVGGNAATQSYAIAQANAAKAAAEATAQGYVNNLQIGGTNLLNLSGRLIETSAYPMADYPFAEVPIVGETYTITLWGDLAPTKTNFQAFNSGGSGPAPGILNQIAPGVYQKTLAWPANPPGVTTPTFLRIYQFTNAQSGTSIIRKIKLEKGSKGTDWSPSPADVQQDATDKSDAALSAAQLYAVAQANAARIAAEGVAGTLFSNLKVGGRNFLLDSSTDLPMLNNNNSTNPATIAWDAVEGCYYVSKLTGQAGSNISTYSPILFASARVSNDFDPSQEWIGSYWVKSQHAITIHLFLGTGSSPIAHAIPANTWVQIYDIGLTSSIRFPGLVVISAVRDSKIWFKHAKLEYGNKPTDWTPAPEDTDTAVAALKTYAENYAQSQANIAQLAAVSAASADATTKANNAVTSAQNMLNALSVGGRNLIRNGNFNGSGNWTLPTGATLVTLPNGQTGVALTVGTPTSARNINQTGIEFQKNQKHTISFWAKADTPTNRLRVIIHQVGGGNNDPQIGYYPEITTEFQKFSHTFTSANNTAKTSFTVNILNYSDSTIDNLIVYGVKLETGDKATDWTPAPEDVQAAIDLADSKAAAAQAAYTALTASLKATAYQDIEQWAIGGKTLVTGGLINTLLLDAAAIRANIINADYINTLEIDAGAIRAGQLTIAARSLVNNPTVSGHLQGWTQGGTGSMAIADVDLNGVLTPAVRLRSTADLQVYTNWFDVDPSRIYEITVWMHCGESSTNNKYFGLHATSTPGGTTNNLAVQRVSTSGVLDGSNNNTYFWNASAATGWRKMVAYLLPTDFEPTDVINMGVGVSRHVLMPSNAKRIRLRFLNYANAGTQRDVYVASPTVVEVSERVFQLAASIRGQAAGAESTALAADSKATNAQTSANSALSQLNDLAADNQLTPNEKLQLKTRWDEIVAEYAEIVQEATRISVATTDFTHYYNILAPYVIGLLSNMTTTSTVVRATFNNNFAQYYAARAILRDNIATKNKSTTDLINSSLSSVVANYNMLGDLAHEDLVEWAKIGGSIKTVGGYLKATLIDVEMLVSKWIRTGDIGQKRILISQAENNFVMFNAANQKLLEIDDDSTPGLGVFYLEFSIPIPEYILNSEANQSSYNQYFVGTDNTAGWGHGNFTNGFPKFRLELLTQINGSNYRYFYRYPTQGFNASDPRADATMIPNAAIGNEASTLRNTTLAGSISEGYTRILGIDGGYTLDESFIALDHDIIYSDASSQNFTIPRFVLSTGINQAALYGTRIGRVLRFINKGSGTLTLVTSGTGTAPFINSALTDTTSIIVASGTTVTLKLISKTSDPTSISNWRWMVISRVPSQ